VIDCLFSDNDAENNGGAIYSYDGALKITNSIFTNNTLGSSGVGSAVYRDNGFDTGEDRLIQNCLIWGNEGNSIHNNSTDEINASNNCWGSSDGAAISGGGGGSGDTVSANVKVDNPLPMYIQHQGTSQAPFCYQGDDSAVTGTGVSLRFGEKRLQETDLFINTPTSILSFERIYRQNQQLFQRHMGLGWTHSHHSYLREFGEDMIEVTLPHVTLILEDDGAGTNFTGTDGSQATLVKSGSVYTLIAEDKSEYDFEMVTGQTRVWLTERRLPTGEIWTYSYTGDQLISVVVNSFNQGLYFAYYDTNDFKDGQLQYVSLNPISGTPTSPYIELDYEDDGHRRALLTKVIDTYGNDWQYLYYGDDDDFPNYLKARIAPQEEGQTDYTVLEHLYYAGAAPQIYLPVGPQFVIVQGMGYTVSDLDSITNSIPTDTSFIRWINIMGTTTTVNTNGQAQQTYTLDGQNNLISNIQQGNTWRTFNYTQKYRLLETKDPYCVATQYTWDPDNNRLASVMDGNGGEVAYCYDSDERVVLRKDYVRGQTTEYTYYSENALNLPDEVKVYVYGTENCADKDPTGSKLRQQLFIYDDGRVITEYLLDPSQPILAGDPPQADILSKIERTYHSADGLLKEVKNFGRTQPHRRIMKKSPMRPIMTVGRRRILCGNDM